MENSCLKQFAFSRYERLRLENDFERVFREGKMIQDENFTILFAENNLGRCRLGIIVKKKFGKAHDRNKIKRWIREVFRHYKVNFNRSFDIIVIPRRTLSVVFPSVDFHHVKDTLTLLLKGIEQA